MEPAREKYNKINKYKKIKRGSKLAESYEEPSSF
jgi:hypothetical protein